MALCIEDTEPDDVWLYVPVSAETLALVFQWTLRLSERGKDVRDFPTAIASYATRAVKSGRKLCSARRPRGRQRKTR